MSTLKSYRVNFTEQLSNTYLQTEIDTFFFYLIEEYLGFKRIDFVLQSNYEIPKEKEELFSDALKRLTKEEPIQYIIEKTEFYGFPFKVNKHTLIPRPETEELVEWVLKEIDNKKLTQKTISILDIGTGTGCIPISLKKNLVNSEVSAIDISTNALKIAKENAVLNNVDINYIEKDILQADKLTKMYDIIISNPPYVRNMEKIEIKNNVIENEPHLALFVEDNNPLLFYIKIADLAKNHLQKNGALFFEINQYLGKETVTMLKDKGYSSVELRKDLFGNDRMIMACL